MKNLKLGFSLVFFAAGWISTGAQASPFGLPEVLECSVSGTEDSIQSIRVVATDLEGQISAEVTNASHGTRQNVSNGDLRDEKIFLFKDGVIGIGETIRYLERGKGGIYQISTYFSCDAVHGEEHCNDDTPRFLGMSGKVECRIEIR